MINIIILLILILIIIFMSYKRENFKEHRIHTIGDSHSYNGWGNMTIHHHLGPVLCYSFGRDKLNKCDISKLNINNGDTVIFCFGEIDCRCHINKYVKKNISYQEVINNMITNYIEAIKLNIENSQLKLKNICIFNIVPPVKKDEISENKEFPFLGEDEERKSYILYFNNKLKEICAKNNYIFFDVYDKYTDENGFLNKELSDGTVHIGNGSHLHKFIIDNNI